MSASKTVLIIEDEDRLRRTVAAYLTDSGYAVIEAANGREGIELFTLKKPDIVVTDLRMPEMNGIEVITWIKTNSPHTPVIVLTGTGDQNAQAAALSQGASAHMAKPIDDLAELEAAIERALRPDGGQT